MYLWALATFFGTPSGYVQVAAEADGDASVAARQVVDEARRGKAFDVGAVFLEQLGCRLDVFGIVAVGVFTHIVQHHRIDFRRAVQVADAALFELGCVFGVEHQIPLVVRQFVRA